MRRGPEQSSIAGIYVGSAHTTPAFMDGVSAQKPFPAENWLLTFNS